MVRPLWIAAFRTSPSAVRGGPLFPSHKSPKSHKSHQSLGLPDFPLAIGIRIYHPHRQLMKKTFPHGVLATCCWLALASVPHAQIGTPDYDPLGEFNHLPKQIRVQVEFIEVSHEQLTELLFAPKVPANDTELRKQLAQLVKDGKAGIVETMLCIARSGQKATTESIEEFIYPTEYEPAELPAEPSKDKDKDDKTKATRLRSGRRSHAHRL